VFNNLYTSIMNSIAYWDIDSLRIRKVASELESRFDLHIVATLGELQQTIMTKNHVAVVIGVPSTDPESLEKMVGMVVRQAKCPVIVILEGQACATDHPGVLVCVSSSDISSLSGRINAIIESPGMGKNKEPRIFIGDSESMLRISALIRKYAESRNPVLILGETGTGKELAANALHTLSSRRDFPFIALNCSALPENLVESELFGAEKGAYTDAVRHKGALVMASRGTLFLDEIGSMSLSVQPKLLRALETGEYWKLGAEKPERSDFRLVCATCENLIDLQENSLFRKDLLYRISDLVIYIPPLRERTEDIGILAEHFCRQAGKGLCELSPDALDRLGTYPWPGNVRELKSVINRACANIQKGSIRAEDVVFISGIKNAMRFDGTMPRPSPRSGQRV
jgi:transcriptional regulator with PAS, ATPase and Fis domain